MSDDGKRENPRHAIDAKILVNGDASQVEGRCRNLSSGGLCAELGERFAVGVKVELAVTLVFDVESFSEPLALPARSVWCTALGDGWQVGFQFLALSSDQDAYLAMFLRFLEEGQDTRPAPVSPKDIFS